MMMDIDSRKFRYLVGSLCILGGSIFNFLETWYFGWNTTPSCPLEMQLDYIANVIIMVGALIIVYVVFIQREKKS